MIIAVVNSERTSTHIFAIVIIAVLSSYMITMITFSPGLRYWHARNHIMPLITLTVLCSLEINLLIYTVQGSILTS